MGIKKTIAVAGVTGRREMVLANKLSTGSYRVLIIAENKDQADKLTEFVDRSVPDNEIEIIQCAREGCWEADIIILAVPDDKKKAIAGKIQDVSTQKIVAGISGVKTACSTSPGENSELEKLFPYSRVINACHITGTSNIYITGRDVEAVDIFSDIARFAGFDPTGAENYQHFIKAGDTIPLEIIGDHTRREFNKHNKYFKH